MTIQTQLHPDALVSPLYSFFDACFTAGHVLLKSLCPLVCMSKVLALRQLNHHLLVLWQSEHLDIWIELSELLQGFAF